MSFGHHAPIYLDNRPRPPHRFNHETVGLAREYANETTSGDHSIITVQAALPLGAPSRYPVFARSVAVACHISTDTALTFFQGEVAQRLSLRPVNPFPHQVHTFLGSYAGWWCRHHLWLSLGPRYLPVEVWFAVERGPRGWEWRRTFPQWNVLGMRGVLKRRMLCLTSEQVYAFERL